MANGTVTKRILQHLQGFSSEQKFVFWGSVAMIVSVFLPWYSDLDAFKTGDMFLGITGPLYLAGLLILGVGVVSATTLLSRNMRDKMERIFSLIGNFYVMSAGFSGFLLLLVNSVYFHPKFGVNIAIKESRVGMFLAFGGVVLLAFGGYLMRKRQRAYHHVDIESNYEPLIKMPERGERRGSVRTGTSSGTEMGPGATPAGVLENGAFGVLDDIRHKTLEDVTTEEERQRTLL